MPTSKTNAYGSPACFSACFFQLPLEGVHGLRCTLLSQFSFVCSRSGLLRHFFTIPSIPVRSSTLSLTGAPVPPSLSEVSASTSLLAPSFLRPSLSLLGTCFRSRLRPCPHLLPIPLSRPRLRSPRRQYRRHHHLFGDLRTSPYSRWAPPCRRVCSLVGCSMLWRLWSDRQDAQGGSLFLGGAFV